MAETATADKIAVIIVNYNAGKLLHECLAALEVQNLPPARVLVMDNGSHDTSIDDCEKRFPNVEYFRLGSNLGFARANNLAVEKTENCEWLALLNPDAFADRGWLQALYRAANEFPNTDAFASCMLSAERRDMVDGAGDSYRVDGLAWPRLHGQSKERLPRQSHEVFAPSAGAGFYRRRAFVDAGGFCERYFCYYEDVDLGFRLRLRGSSARFVPDAIVYHVGSALAGKGSDFSIYHAHRNNVWTYVRNMPGRLFWWYLPAHVLANIVSVALFVWKGRSRVIWRAKRDALAALPATWRERRGIQAASRVSAESVRRAMERGNALEKLWRQIFQRLRAKGRGARR